MRVDPKSILIVLHGSIGDVTRGLPLASLIRKGFPDVKLSWAVEAPSFPLVEHYRAVDEVILFEAILVARALAVPTEDPGTAIRCRC